MKKAFIVITILAFMIFSLTIPTEAAITTGSSTYATSGSGYTVTIAKPADTTAGDVLVACIVATSNLGSRPEVTPPAGWQLIRHTYATQNWYYDMVTYFKVAGTSEPSSYAWTSTHLNTSGGISRLTGVDVNHVVDVSAEAQGQGSNLAVATAPSVATTYNNDIVINFFGNYSPLTTPYFVEQAGINELYEYTPPKSGSNEPPSLAAYHWTMNTAGSTGTRTCTLTSTVSTVRWVAQTVAFKAAPRAYFPATSTSASESETSHSVGVTLAPNAEGPVEVYFTVSGTAEPGRDYTLTTPSPITVGTGSGSANIGFSIVEDSLYEQDETIIITLTSGQEYFLTGNTQYIYTIANDDVTAPTSVIAAGASCTSVSPVTSFPPPLALQVLQINNPGSAGDLLLAAITRHGKSWDQSIVPPAGWNLIRETYYANSQGLTLATYYKIAGSSEPTSYTFGIPEDGSMSGYHASGGITAYTGVDIVDPIDTINATASTMPAGTTGTVYIPSVFPEHTNDRIVAVVGVYNPVTGISAPTDMTERYEIKHSIDPYNSFDREWPTTQVSDMAWAPATGTGTRTAAVQRFLTNQNTDWVAQTIALKTSRLSISDVSFAEGNSGSANAIVTVSLDNPTNVPVTFNWLTEDGTAVAGNDYMLFGGNNCTIPKGQTSYELVIPIYGDVTLESDEVFYVNLANVTGATVADSRGAVTILNNDSSVSINDVSQNEGNSGITNLNFTVSISPACLVPVSVTYNTLTEGTAEQHTDYYFTAGTLNFEPNQTSKTLSIPVIGDTLFESNETIVVFLSSATNAQITRSRATGTIVNDDVQIPTMSINDVSRVEGNSGTANLVFTVSLSNTIASAVTANYTTANGTATAGSDYTLTSGTLNIAAGQTSGTISVPIIGDTTYEQNETFYVNLSSPTNATINDGTGLGTITNDDALTMSINDVSLAEGNSGVTNFVFTVTLNGICGSTTTVDYAATGGTATPGPDYNSVASAPLTFNAGDTSKTIIIQVNGDTTYEDDETFFVNLSNASGATISDGQGLGTILNDDTIPTYTLTMAATPGSSGSATDLTGTSPYVAGTSVNIHAAPVTGYHFVNWTAPAGSFADANDASTTFTMPAQAATVTANFALDTYTVAFDSQGGSTVTSLIVPQGDLVDRPADPTRSGYIFVGWFKDAACTDDWVFADDAVKANITLYARWAVLDQILNATGSSVDTFSGVYAQTFTAGRTGGLYRVSCYLSNPSSPFTMTMQIQGVTADDKPNGNILASRTLDLNASQGRWVDASFAEPISIVAGQRYAIVWSGFSTDARSLLYGSPTDSYAGGRALTISYSGWYPANSIQDFSFRTFVLTSPGITVTPATGLVTAETGETDTFTVVLNNQPTADVTVGLSSSDATEGTVSPANLTFTASSWNTPQLVTATGVDDDQIDGDIVYTITATASSADLSYHGLFANASLTNTDVEGIAPVVSENPTNQSMTYGANTAFSAAATGTPSPTAQWQVSTDGGSSYSNISDGGVYSGTATATLNLVRPPVSFSGYRYRAVFANGINPNATTSAATLTVSPLGITGSFTTADKVYDGTTAADALNRSLTGVLTGDTVSLTGGTAAFADKNVGASKTVALSGAVLAGANCANYSLNSVETETANITAKNLTISGAAAQNKTYDGDNVAVVSFTTASLAGVVSSDVGSVSINSTACTAAFSDKNAGNAKPVSVLGVTLGGASAANYTVPQPIGLTANITPLDITGSFTTEDKVYDGTTGAAILSRSLTGVLSNDDDVELAGGTAAFDNKNAGTGKTVILSKASLAGADVGNYHLTNVANATADITQKSVTPLIIANDKVYDGTTTAILGSQTVSGVISPDVVPLLVGAASFSEKNVGEWTVTATALSLGGTDAGNYTLSATSALDTAKIAAYGLTITGVAAVEKIYDGKNTATLNFAGASLVGILGSDSVSISAAGHSAMFDNKNVGKSKPVTVLSIALSGDDAANYTVAPPNGLAADITPLGITGSFTAANKVYDGTTTAIVLSQSLTGVLSVDPAVSLTGGTAAFADKNAGTGKTVTLAGAALAGTGSENYILTSVATATANITQKPVTPSIVANNKVYDGTITATLSSQTVSGAISPDIVTLVVGSANFADKDVGLRTVTATTLSLGGADAGNYKLSAPTAKDEASITALNLTISGAVAQNKVYDGNDTAIVDFSKALLVGTLDGESVSINSAGYSAAFANKNVGADKLVSVSGVSLSGADALNYTVSQPSSLPASITPLAITGSFTADHKVYDGATTATVLDRSLTGVLTDDAVTLTGGTAAFANENAGGGKTVTLSGASLTGSDAGNYSLSSVSTTTASITPKPVAPSIVANNKVYDGTTTATLSSQLLSGVISPDDVTLVVGSANFADVDIGSWTVTATSLSLGGDDAGNYELSAVTATDVAAITALNLTITGATAVDKVYNGNPVATVNFGGSLLVGVIGQETVSINSDHYTAAFTNKNVGADKPVSVSGVSLSGADAANYTVSQPDDLTASITPLGITGSFTAENKTYDGTTDAAVATIAGRSLTGVLNGDAVTLTGGTAAFADKNAGTGKTVTLSGASLAGTDAENYNLISVADDTADITVRPIEVTAAADTKVYDGSTSSDGEPTVTSVPGLATGDTADWSQTFSTKDAGTDKTLSPAGTINDGNKGANYDVTFTPVNKGVIEKAELTVTADNKTSQYSDARLPFSAAWSGFVAGEELATSGITGDPAYTTNPVLADPITQAVGSYTIIPSLGSLAANNYSFNFANGTYTVTPEDAALHFDSQNLVSVRVAADGGKNSAFIWQATIAPANDGVPGDLNLISPTEITLTFLAVGGGAGGSCKAKSFDPDTGIATFEVPANTLGVETYSAIVTLNNTYFKGSPDENVLVIYDPSLGFTTGGGWFYWPTGTANPELEGAKTNFGFTMKYNRKGTSVQGSFLLIAHQADGSIIRIKSNAVYGMAILENSYPGIASFSGKCVYTRVDALGNVLATAGNQDFTAYVKDMNEPGEGTDMFWFTTKLTIVGEDPFSLDGNTDNKVDEAEYASLGGGNIVVPHKSSSSDDIVDEEPPPNNGKKK